MSDRLVRIGVIGVGSWTNRVHIPQILSHPAGELVTLCARSEEKLNRVGKDLGISNLYIDYRELMEQDELDAVTISSTHNAHYEIAKAALERGLHVFCEKPLGVNSTQTEELATLASKTGLKNMVAFTNRWMPEAIYAKQLIAEGFCGEVFHYNVCQLASYGRPGGNWMWRADPELAGGGVLFDLGGHNIDLAMWLNGPIKAICAHQKNTSPQRPKDGRMLPTLTDDTNVFIAVFADGSQGVFHISWTAPGDRIMRHEIAGRDGLLAISLYHDEWINSLSGCRAGETELRPLAVPNALQKKIPRAVETGEERDAAHQTFLENYPSLVRAFIDCIVNDTEPVPDFAEGHKTQKVMDAIITSHREKRWVDISK